MLKRFLAGLIVAVAMASGAVAGPLEDAVAADTKGDYATALKLYLPLAEQGNADAQAFLGYLYAVGNGVRQDYAEAVKWYQLSAAQGDLYAQVNLAGMYEEGQGVPKDYVLAYMWFNLAAAKDNIPSEAYRDNLAKLMTPDQIAEAQRMAREWKPTPGH
jgi:hypothetical protein